MAFQCINIRQVSWEVLKTEAEGLGLQHLPRDLANVNAWKTMFDPYIQTDVDLHRIQHVHRKFSDVVALFLNLKWNYSYFVLIAESS